VVHHRPQVRQGARVSVCRSQRGQFADYPGSAVVLANASVGGDHNPTHTNPIAAKLFGFPTVIAHGMFSAAAVLANLEGQAMPRVRKPKAGEVFL